MNQKPKKKVEKVSAKVQVGGRVTIPKSVLNDLGIQEGDFVMLDIRRGKIIED
jgi:AbrB family looped-hinge helix DNA binding protein